MRCGLADLARLFCFLRRTRANRDRTPEPESSRAKVAPTPGAQPPEDREWEERYSELEASEKSRAKSAVDDADVDYPCPLRMWLYKQRFLYDNNFLDRDRVDKLQALGVFRDKPIGTPSPESGTASTLSATDYGDEAAVDASYEEPSRIGTSSTVSATDYDGEDEGEEKNRFES